MNWKHLIWIIPLTISLSIVLWQGIVINPTDKMHWDITHACLRELYNMSFL